MNLIGWHRELTRQALDEGGMAVALEVGADNERLRRENARLRLTMEQIRETCNERLARRELDGWRIERAVEYVRDIAHQALAPEPVDTE